MIRTSKLFLAFLTLAFVARGSAQQIKEPVDYVDPNIGGIGQLLSSAIPRVMLPFGMMTVVPTTTPSVGDRYLADKLYGFPTGGLNLMPMTGAAETDSAKYATMYDHDLETVKPYYYKAYLEKYNVEVEVTVSAHAAYYRLKFPAGTPAHVLFSVPRGGEIALPGSGELTGRGGSSSRRPLAPLGRGNGLRLG